MDFTKLSKEEIVAFANIDPEYEKFLKTFPSGGGIDYSDSNKALETLRYLTSLAPVADPDPKVSEETIHIPVKDGHLLETNIYRSAASQKHPSPLVVLFHGGGYMFGFPRMMTRTARLLASKLGVVVAAPTYRLAPENPFPAAINDARDVVGWLHKHAADLGANVEAGFIVGGSDVGANLVLVLAHLDRDEETASKFTGLYLSAPCFAPDANVNLDQKYVDRLLSPTDPGSKDDKLQNDDLFTLGMKMYKPDTSSKLFSQLTWPGEKGHRDLPPTYFQVCGRDSGRDYTLILEDMLKSEGVKTKVDIYQGMPHCFWYPLKQHPETWRWEKDTVRGVGWVLGVENVEV